MGDISNSFAVLQLDVDDGLQDNDNGSSKTAATILVSKSTSNGERRKGAGRKKTRYSSRDVTVIRSQRSTQEDLALPSEEFNKPLVWIDLEMTGLDIEVDRILEIACVITNGNLTKTLDGPEIVIHQSKECMDKMGEWCQRHHADSGLIKMVLQSTITEREAEKQVAEFVKCNIRTCTPRPLLAGNSVYTDFIFLKKYMPNLAGLFSHVLVDVSSISALCIRWYPREHRKAPEKQKNHRALDDIKESIRELRYYRENIFKAK